MFNLTEIRRVVNICTELQITAEQLMFCIMVQENRVQEMYRYTHEINFDRTLERIYPKKLIKEVRETYPQFAPTLFPYSLTMIEDLIEKGYLKRYKEDDGDLVDNFIVLDKFNTKVFNSFPEESGKEVWDAYPEFIRVDGKKLAAKSCSKDEWVIEYARKYGRYKNQHKKIMEAVKYGRESQLITWGIKKFMEAELWDYLLAAQKESTKSVSPAGRLVGE